MTLNAPCASTKHIEPLHRDWAHTDLSIGGGLERVPERRKLHVRCSDKILNDATILAHLSPTEHFQCGLGHPQSKKQEVLDLSQETHDQRVEIHAYDSGKAGRTRTTHDEDCYAHAYETITGVHTNQDQIS